MYSIVLRADADRVSGTGDLVSLVNLSRYFRTWRVYIVTKDTPVAKAIIQRRGVRNVRYLPPSITFENEIRFLNGFIREKGIDAVFIEITARKTTCYRKIAAPFKACVNFDGIIPKGFDMVVNWDVGAEMMYKRRKFPATLFLLGPRYVFLKPEILLRANRVSYTRPAPLRPKSILIFFGGFDEFNFTLKVIRMIARLGATRSIRVIVGAGYRHSRQLAGHLSKNPASAYTVRHNVTDIECEYSKADLIITSGGMSLFEAVAFKKPVAVIATYRHQIKRSAFFGKQGLVEYLGFRRCDPSRLKKALEGRQYKTFNKRFFAETIPAMIHERLDDKI